MSPHNEEFCRLGWFLYAMFKIPFRLAALSTVFSSYILYIYRSLVINFFSQLLRGDWYIRHVSFEMERADIPKNCQILALVVDVYFIQNYYFLTTNSHLKIPRKAIYLIKTCPQFLKIHKIRVKIHDLESHVLHIHNKFAKKIKICFLLLFFDT